MEFIYLFKKLFYLRRHSRPQALRHIFGVALLHGDRTSSWPPSCAPVPGVEGGPPAGPLEMRGSQGHSPSPAMALTAWDRVLEFYL